MGRRVLRFDGAFGHTFGVRVQRVQKVQRVQRVADCRSAVHSEHILKER